MTDPSLDKADQFVVTRLRDPGIEYLESMIAGRLRAPSSLQLQNQLRQSSAEQIALIRAIVTEAVDHSVHAFLFGLSEASTLDEGIELRCDGNNIVALSDGLEGEPFGESGWYARFSKHGPDADAL